MKKNLTEYKEYVEEVIFIATVVGIISQVVPLLILAKGFWILPFFSISYVVTEGFAFLSTFILLLVGFWMVIDVKNMYWESRKTGIYYTLMGFALTGIIAYLLFQNNSMYSLFPIVLFVSLIKALFSKEHEAKDSFSDFYNRIFNYLFWFVIIVATLHSAQKILPPGEDWGKQSFMYEEQKKKHRNISGLYMNDNYVFIKVTENNQDKVIIKKLDDFLKEDLEKIIPK